MDAKSKGNRRTENEEHRTKEEEDDDDVLDAKALDIWINRQEFGETVKRERYKRKRDKEQ